MAEKARHKRIHDNELLSSGGKKTEEKQIGAAKHVQVTAMKWARDGGWWMETMRPNIEVAVASRNRSYDNDTGCGDGGKGIERPGTVRRMFIAWQRSNRVVIRVCFIRVCFSRLETCSSIQN